MGWMLKYTVDRQRADGIYDLPLSRAAREAVRSVELEMEDMELEEYKKPEARRVLADLILQDPTRHIDQLVDRIIIDFVNRGWLHEAHDCIGCEHDKIRAELAEYQGIEGRCPKGHNKKFTYELGSKPGCVACERDQYAAALKSILDRTTALKTLGASPEALNATEAVRNARQLLGIEDAEDPQRDNEGVGRKRRKKAGREDDAGRG